jgi:hypothetical protein
MTVANTLAYHNTATFMGKKEQVYGALTLNLSTVVTVAVS